MLSVPTETASLDFRQLFESSPHPCLALRADAAWTILAVNDAYLAATGTPRADLVGRALFDLFPDRLCGVAGTDAGDLRLSLERVRRDRVAHTMGPQQCNLRNSTGDGIAVRYWRPVNLPVLDAHGSVAIVLHHVEDMTHFVAAGEREPAPQAPAEALSRAAEIKDSERSRAESALLQSETRYRSLFDHMLEGFAYCRMLYAHGRPHDFVYVDVNAAFEQLTGLTGVRGRKVSELIPGFRESNPELLETFGRVAAGGSPQRMETYVEALDLWFSLAVYSTEPGTFVAVFDNITERKKAEADLNLAACVFHHTTEGVMVTDTSAHIVAVNPAFTHITGYSAQEAIGHKPSLVRSDHHGPDFYRELWSILLRDGIWQGEIWNRRKSGEVYLEWLTISSVAGADGKPVRYLGVFNDITESRRKDAHIRHLAFHDPLTDLPNRALMMNRLEHGIACAQREHTRLGVMFIDLDRFKAVNDSLGHDVGDALLQEVARRLKQALRASDTVARLGGDEFVILLEHADALESYAALAEKIIAVLSEPAELAGHAIQVNASIGISCFPDDGANAADLMKHADAAMYAAKSAGRGTYRFFRAAMTEKAMQRLKLETELRNAARNGELELFYQPQLPFGAAPSMPYAVEALVRWRHPTLGLLLPADFIGLAEEAGIIGELGDWVLEQACRQSRLWRQSLGRVRIAVNISERQLAHGDLVQRILRLTQENGIAPSDLGIELTESAVMSNPEEITRLLARLRGIGVTVAVDDFGTGYSSLAFLRRLPIDALKIDRSFVMNADRDQEDAQIVRAIIALAQALKLEVVAEGVETENQSAFLKSCGCTAGQGFLYARPAPAAQTGEWLQNRRGAGGA